MNFISMYSAQININPSIQEQYLPGLHPYQQQQIVKLLCTIAKHRTFSATIITPTLSGYNRILIPNQVICFSLTQTSKNINYEYMFQVSLNLQTNLWKITATIMKNGRMINICKQGLVQMLSTYTLNMNAHMALYTLRMHPYTGVVKFSFNSQCTKKLFDDIFRFPVDFCQRVFEHVKEMTNRLDQRFLGKILHITNQLSISTILPTNLASKLPEETPQYINKLCSENPLFSSCNLFSVYKKYRILKDVRKFIINSHIKYSFLSKDPETHKIRFFPDIFSKKQFQKENRTVRHNKVIPFSRDIKKILGMYTSLDTLYEETSIYGTNKNFDVSQIEPTPEEIKSIYQTLKIDHFRGAGRVLTQIRLHSVERETVIGLGGFAEINCVVVNLRIQTQKSKNPQQKKLIKQVLARKSASKQKLFMQKLVIQRFGEGSCIFINKFYDAKLDPESIGLDKTFVDNSIFMEYCPEKSLNNFLGKLSSIMSLKIKIFLLTQVINGLRYLRDFGIVHLDMKPENLLVKMANTPTSNAITLIKIIDFGEAYGQTLIPKKMNRGHTCPYASPQLVRHTSDKFTQKSDVFSIGVMILIIIFQINTVELKRLTSANLFESNQKYIKFYSICLCKCRYLGYEPLLLSLLNLAYKCIHPNPTSRPYLDWICVVLNNLLSMFDCLET